VPINIKIGRIQRREMRGDFCEKKEKRSSNEEFGEENYEINVTICCKYCRIIYHYGE
jgi:hypothetical protein